MPTVVIGENTGDDYSGTEDCYLRENSATTNFNNLIIAGEWSADATDRKHPLISFSGISNLPASLTVSSATLALYQESASSVMDPGPLSCVFHRCLRNWGEGTATWNTYDGTNNWTTAGGLSDSNDRDATTTGTLGISVVTSGYYSISTAQLATEVEGFADGTYSNYGWITDTQPSTNDVESYFTYKGSTDGQRPYLSVTYTTSTGRIMGSLAGQGGLAGHGGLAGIGGGLAG